MKNGKGKKIVELLTQYCKDNLISVEREEDGLGWVDGNLDWESLENYFDQNADKIV